MDGGVDVASSFYLSDEMVELRNLIGDRGYILREKSIRNSVHKYIY
jgi:hypothetical protein